MCALPWLSRATNHCSVAYAETVPDTDQRLATATAASATRVSRKGEKEPF